MISWLPSLPSSALFISTTLSCGPPPPDSPDALFLVWTLAAWRIMSQAITAVASLANRMLLLCIKDHLYWTRCVGTLIQHQERWLQEPPRLQSEYTSGTTRSRELQHTSLHGAEVSPWSTASTAPCPPLCTGPPALPGFAASIARLPAPSWDLRHPWSGSRSCKPQKVKVASASLAGLPTLLSPPANHSTECLCHPKASTSLVNATLPRCSTGKADARTLICFKRELTCQMKRTWPALPVPYSKTWASLLNTPCQARLTIKHPHTPQRCSTDNCNWGARRTTCSNREEHDYLLMLSSTSCVFHSPSFSWERPRMLQLWALPLRTDGNLGDMQTSAPPGKGFPPASLVPAQAQTVAVIRKGQKHYSKAESKIWETAAVPTQPHS